jgi:hypothetical protein
LDILHCLIEANPWSLLTAWTDPKGDKNTSVQYIARRRYVLLPWIAQNFDWVLKDPRAGLLTGDNSPVLSIVKAYRRGKNRAEDLQVLFENFPAALRQSGEAGYSLRPALNYPVQVILQKMNSGGRNPSWNKADENLVMRCVEIDPEILLLASGHGTKPTSSTPLNEVCIFLAEANQNLSRAENKVPRDEGKISALLSEIQSACRIAHRFISLAPQTLLQRDGNDKQPIEHFNRDIFSCGGLLADLLIRMMRYHTVRNQQPNDQVLRSNQFLREIQELLEKEMAVAKNQFLQLRTAVGNRLHAEEGLPVDEQPTPPGECAGNAYKAWAQAQLDDVDFAAMKDVKDTRKDITGVKAKYLAAASEKMLRRRQRRMAREARDQVNAAE